jgi:hypothetical protein
MRYFIALVGCIVGFAGCDIDISTGFGCTDRTGELHMLYTLRSHHFVIGDVMYVGDTARLEVEVRRVSGVSPDRWGGCAPEYGELVPATIEWSSSNTRVATINTTGLVTFRGSGETILTARAPAHSLALSREVVVAERSAPGP